MRKSLFALAVLVTLSVHAVGWKNLSDNNWYSGPKLTEADLAGKVVLVDCWGVACPPCRALLPRMEALWRKYRSRPFVLVGSHCQGRQPDKVKALVEANKLTYPIYERFGLAEGEPSFRGIPFLYVVDPRGKLLYSGYDEDAAVSAIGKALAQVNEAPSLAGGVALKKYKPLAKKLVLGKNVKSVVKQLEGDMRKAESKAASAGVKEQAEEAKAILDAIAAAKAEIKSEIDAKRETDPVSAWKLAKDYVVTFPEEGADLKAELPAMAEKAKAAAAKKQAESAKPEGAKAARKP